MSERAVACALARLHPQLSSSRFRSPRQDVQGRRGNFGDQGEEAYASQPLTSTSRVARYLPGAAEARGAYASRMLRLALVIASVVSFVVLGCTSSSPGSVADAGQPPGVDAGVHHVACAPRSQESVEANTFTSAALPAGACGAADVTCELLVRDPCAACPMENGPTHLFTCDCPANSWSCRITSRGTALCRSANNCAGAVDAGGDAVTD